MFGFFSSIFYVHVCRCKFLTSQAAQILHILEDSDSSSSELFASTYVRLILCTTVLLCDGQC